MTETRKEKRSDNNSLTADDVRLAAKETEPEVSEIVLFSKPTDSLMPELEELVKKNPNRLIGCGG